MKTALSSATLIFAFLAASFQTIHAFVPPSTSHSSDCTTRRSSHQENTVEIMMTHDDNTDSVLSRRSWIARQMFGASMVAGTTSITTTPPPANALVYVDPDRYGDKELQVGLVNKVRQSVRDAILQDSKLAPLFLQVAIQDALSYSQDTQSGGPNGGIVAYLLENSKSYPSLAYAAQQLQAIRTKLRQSTEITMADVVTFAGAEAIESLGGPRIGVQLGKLDGSDETPHTIYDLNNGPETIHAFGNAGLTQREVTLLVGAIASMNKVVDDNVKPTEETATTDNEEEEVNEMGDPQVDFPSSFGAPSQIYGKKLGSMDNSIFDNEVALQKGKQATGVWADAVVGEWTTRYSKSGFFKDLPEAYSRLVKVGSTGRWEG